MARPLNIMLVVPRLDVSYPLAYLEQLTAELRARRHSLLLVTPGGPGLAQLERLGVRVHAVPSWTADIAEGDGVSIRTALRLGRDHNTELIHATSQRMARAASRLAHSLRVPYVTTVHHLPPGAASLPVTKYCGGFIAISEWMRQSLVNQLRVPKDCISVVRYGVDTARYHRIPKPDGDGWIPVIGTYGRLRREKGIDILLQAARYLKEDGRDAEILVVGDGPLQRRLRALADRLDLRRRVTFYGDYAPSSETIPSFDVYVQPNTAEPLGIELVEAMACGLPVVATSVGGVGEVMSGSMGELVPPNDARAFANAIELLLADKQVREERGAAGLQAAQERHTLAQMVDGTEALYDYARRGEQQSARA